MSIEEIIKTSSPLPFPRKAIVNLLYTEKWLSEQMNAGLKSYDISIQQFNVLRILRGQKGKPANLSTIQERMVSKMSNTTRLVDKLINKGYVNRTVCPSNRRKVEITITEKGSIFLEEVSNVIVTIENTITASLSEKELIELNRLLDKLKIT